VLADEVDDPRAAVRAPVVERVLRLPGGLRPLLGGRDIADRRVEPDVEELVGRARDGEPEVRPVARDVPVRQALLEELLELRGDAGVEELRLRDEAAQKVGVLREREEEGFGGLADGRIAAEYAARIDQLRGRVG